MARQYLSQTREYQAVCTLVSVFDMVKMLWPQLYRGGGRSYTVKCPFHDDSTASFRLSVERNKATCFGACARVFDPVELAAEATEMSRSDALRWVIQHFDLDVSLLERASALSRYEETVADPYEIWDQGDEPEAREYLEGVRGIPSAVLDSTMARALNGRVYFPHLVQSEYGGFITALSSRAMSDLGPRHLYMEGPLGGSLYGLETVVPGRPVGICEGAIDALSLRSVLPSTVSVRLKSLSPEYLRPLEAASVWVMALDGDQAGRVSTERVRQFASVPIIDVGLPDGQDCNQVLMDGRLYDLVVVALRKAQSEQIRASIV